MFLERALTRKNTARRGALLALALALLAALLASCGGGATETAADPLAPLALPAVAAVAGDGPLRVVATTSIIGDVVAQVGGEAIALTTLMAPGQDPHSFQPAAADLAAAADAGLVFVNGWNLEEGLIADLAAATDAPLVPVSAGITPRPAAADPRAADPHVWQDVAQVMQWVDNIAATLSAAAPAQAATFAANAVAYRAELAALDDDVRAATAAIPAARRVLVTNHDTLAYFAAAYDFRVLGSVIPGVSTLAEATAGNLATLAGAMDDAGVCSLFVETTAADQLARALSEELDGCASVRVLSLYSDALGPPGSGADSYIGMMRANVATIVAGLQ